MPYLRVDLDARKRAAAAAPVIGLPHQHVKGGLEDLWEWCWSEKTDRVETIQLEGIFGCSSPRLAEALVAFGFLEPLEGGYRVKGAERYLGLSKARSEGGRKGGLASALVRSSKQSRSKPEAKPKLLHPDTQTPRHPYTQQEDSAAGAAGARERGLATLGEAAKSPLFSEAPTRKTTPGRNAPLDAEDTPEKLRAVWNELRAGSVLEWPPLQPTEVGSLWQRLKERTIDGDHGWRAILARAVACPKLNGAEGMGGDTAFVMTPVWLFVQQKGMNAVKVEQGGFDSHAVKPKIEIRKGPVRAEDMNWTGRKTGEISWNEFQTKAK